MVREHDICRSELLERAEKFRDHAEIAHVRRGVAELGEDLREGGTTNGLVSFAQIDQDEDGLADVFDPA